MQGATHRQKSRLRQHHRRRVLLAVGSAVALVTALQFGATASAATVAPFGTLASGYVQTLYGSAASSTFFGGVAFAPNGDVWVADCEGTGTLHRFSASSTYLQDGNTLHIATTVASDVGCGLAGGGNGVMYSNTFQGVATINANTGAPISTAGAAGDDLGIALDPQTGNIVYVAADGATLYSLDMSSNNTTDFSTSAPSGSLIDGIAFDPSGDYLFASDVGLSEVLVFSRSGALLQTIPDSGGPDGIAFHVSPSFVVVNNNNGTIDQLTFPAGNFTQAPTVDTFASGGYRGDLTQVGSDGCMYVTQDGTNFADGTTSSNNSIVQICPGFAPPAQGGSTRSSRYVALGDSVPYGHGLSNPYRAPQIGTGALVSQGPSNLAWPSLVASVLHYSMGLRTSNCSLSGDNLSISGAHASSVNAGNAPVTEPSASNFQCSSWGPYPLFGQSVPGASGNPSIQGTEVAAASLSTNPAALVTIQAGADDIGFGDCLKFILSFDHLGKSCLTKGEEPTSALEGELAHVTSSLLQTIKQVSPDAGRVAVVGYYQPIPAPSNFDASSAYNATSFNPVCLLLAANMRLNKTTVGYGPDSAYDAGVILTAALNTAIIRAVKEAQAEGVSNVAYVNIEGLEVGHEMCTADPALFSGEAWSYASLTGPVFGNVTACRTSEFNPVVCALAAKRMYEDMKGGLEAHTWRVAHPNRFGQQDIAKAVLTALQG